MMMNTSAILTKQNKISRTRLIVLIVLLVLSSIGMFGQNSNQETGSSMFMNKTMVVSNEETIVTEQNSAAANNSNLNFVSWFMGTKQTPNVKFLNNPSQNSKRQIINSGIAPNGLLLKVFLKKAINYNSTIA